jgi:hypothetical protein
LAVAYPAGTNLDRSLRLALAIIRDSTAKRPIYFATTNGMMADLGLEQWGVRHGLATKLILQPAEVLDGLGFTQVPVELGGERFDVARSLALYDQVYSYRGLLDRSLWTDRSTLNIPWQYYALALQLADAVERSEGSPEVAERLRLDAANFQVTSEGGSRRN